VLISALFTKWSHDCKAVCCKDEDDEGGWKSNYETLSYNATRNCSYVNCTADAYGTNLTAVFPCKDNCECSHAGKIYVDLLDLVSTMR